MVKGNEWIEDKKERKRERWMNTDKIKKKWKKMEKIKEIVKRMVNERESKEIEDRSEERMSG